ncbi:MAG: helix-turn-helix domain-containing protein, partial [Verrucomicrobia bacterium]|nr:helix-turn-helix domain-containing protein [Verrucomicrobiota bacterium]
MGYFQLSDEERYKIGAMKTAGSSMSDIARALKR